MENTNTLEDTSVAQATKTLNSLKSELSIKQDNLHCGSGLGGNITEYMFLLMHVVHPIVSHTDPTNIGWFKSGDNVNLRLSPDFTNTKENMATLRQSLTAFIAKEFPTSQKFESFDLQTVTALAPSTQDMKMLHKCLSDLSGLNLKQKSDNKLSLDDGDVETIKNIESSFPTYMKIFCWRNVVGLDTIISMNLDAYLSVTEDENGNLV